MMPSDNKNEKMIERKIERKLLHDKRLNVFAGINMVGFIGWCVVMPFLIFVGIMYIFKDKITDLPASGKALIVFGCFVLGAFNTARYIKKENDILKRNYPGLPKEEKTQETKEKKTQKGRMRSK